MKAGPRTALQLFGTVALLAGLTLLTDRFEGCGEKLTPPPPARWPGVHAVSTTGLAAALVRGGDNRLLLRDDAEAAVVVQEAVMILLPPSEHRPPAEAIAAALAPLPPDVRAALWDRTALVVWLGHGQGQTADPAVHPSWDPSFRLDLVHDDLTDAGCLVRVATPPDPAHAISRRKQNSVAKKAAAAEELFLAALGHSGASPFTADEATAARAHGWELMHGSGIWAQHERTFPPSAIILLTLLLLFHWRASADGDDTIAKVDLATLDRDGALIIPAEKGQGYRIVTYGLLHTGFEHLINNCLSIWIGCYLVEAAIGAPRTLLIFLAGVVAAGWARLRMKRPGHLVGASGGAFALNGAGLALVLMPGPWVPLLEQHSFMVMLGVMLGLGLLLSLLPNISLIGHFAGATAGGLLVVTRLATIGRPTLDGAGVERPVFAAIAWALAGLSLAAWVAAGIWVRHLSGPGKSADPKK